MDGKSTKNNNLDDVFMTDIDEHTSQQIISNIEQKRELENIKNVIELSYNEAYLSVSQQENTEYYDKGFSDGKSYTLAYGDILGRIEAFKTLNNNNLIKSKESDLETLGKIKEEMENFSGKLTKDIINSYNNKINKIISNYIKLDKRDHELD